MYLGMRLVVLERLRGIAHTQWGTAGARAGAKDWMFDSLLPVRTRISRISIYNSENRNEAVMLHN